MSITLQQLEQEAARRVGPFYAFAADAQSPSTATTTQVFVPGLRSNIDLDSVTNLWILRRTAADHDRQRQVSTYDADSGGIYPDAPWQVPPAAGEALEFHHFDPAQELRVAVLAGLRRCFAPETVQVTATGQYGTGIDLTAQVAWLTDPWQIADVRYGWLAPYWHVPYGAYTQMGHLILSGNGAFAYMPNSLWIDSWRPVWSLVNGADSTTGPVTDTDVLEVDIDYAAAAAHIEAWHHFPSRMQVAAAGGTQATQAMTAQEFSRQSGIFGPSRSISVGFETTGWSYAGRY